MLAIGGGKKGLAVAGTATVIDSQYGIAMIHEILNLSVVSTHGLAARPAMHIDNSRYFVSGGRFMRLVIDGRYNRPIERLEADYLRFHQIGRVDFLAQALRELFELAGIEIMDKQVIRR